jgi:hypothetical protein
MFPPAGMFHSVFVLIERRIEERQTNLFAHSLLGKEPGAGFYLILPWFSSRNGLLRFDL